MAQYQLYYQSIYYGIGARLNNSNSMLFLIFIINLVFSNWRVVNDPPDNDASDQMPIHPGTADELCRFSNHPDEKDLYFFGGYGNCKGAGCSGDLNLFWRFSTSEQTWYFISGRIDDDRQANNVGAHIVGGRMYCSGWALPDKIALYGGTGYCDSIIEELCSDLWIYDKIQDEWTFTAGSSIGDRYANAGNRLSCSSSYHPGGRLSFMTWVLDGDMWLFGGEGFGTSGSTSTEGDMNDLWVFRNDTSEFCWMHGSLSRDPTGVYQTKGQYHANNIPDPRYSAATWVVQSERALCMFGGVGSYDYYSDTWCYKPSEDKWNWLHGDQVTDKKGVIGAGYYRADVIPGGRYNAFSATTYNDRYTILWGGYGYAEEHVVGDFHSVGYLNDMWIFDNAPGNAMWKMWVTSSTPIEANVFGSSSYTFDPANFPSGRTEFASRFSSDSNSFYIVNGNVHRQDGTTNAYYWDNRVWEFDLSAVEYADPVVSFDCFSKGHNEDGVCNNNGLCVAQDKCVCMQGFYGTQCNVIECYDHFSNETAVCSGTGICVYPDSCDCSPGFLGSRCQLNSDTSKFVILSDRSAYTNQNGEVDSLGSRQFPAIFGTLTHPYFYVFAGESCPFASGACGGGGHYHNEMHKYTIQSNTWEYLPYAGSTIEDDPGNYTVEGVYNFGIFPSARWQQAYSTTATDGVIFGGSGQTGVMPDLWFWKLSTERWKFIGPQKDPSTDVSFPTEYDKFVDMNSFYPGSSTQLTMHFDSSRNQLVLVCGVSFMSGGSRSHNSMWAFNLGTMNQWSLLDGDKTSNSMGNYVDLGKFSDNARPRGRGGHASWIYNDLVFMMGGYNAINDLWKFSLVTKKWFWIAGDVSTVTSPVYNQNFGDESTSYPGSRYHMAYSTISHYGLLFGGYAYEEIGPENGNKNDFWMIDFDTDEMRYSHGPVGVDDLGDYSGDESLTYPRARIGGAMLTTQDYVYLVCGETYFAANLNDVWRIELDFYTCGGFYPYEEISVCNGGKGNCVSQDKCVCDNPDEYVGDLCDIPICYTYNASSNDACSGRGECTSPDTCVCDSPSEWTGEKCELPICGSYDASSINEVCSGRGVCTAPETCVCNEPLLFDGTLCENDLSADDDDDNNNDNDDDDDDDDGDRDGIGASASATWVVPTVISAAAVLFCVIGVVVFAISGVNCFISSKARRDTQRMKEELELEAGVGVVREDEKIAITPEEENEQEEEKKGSEKESSSDESD